MENTLVNTLFNKDEIKEKCIKTIENLFEKYEKNEYIINRLNSHITSLNSIIENELNNHEKRIDRNNYLCTEQQLFIKVFLEKNLYYYLSTNNHYYEYNGVNYEIIKEDDIVHKLLSSISRDRVLLQWKHKTKINILKLIKERNLFDSIPESETIQNVLNILYPYVFNNKTYAKYLLTIIGDNILKKNQNLIFLISPHMKKFLLKLEYISSNFLGINNLSNNFMSKYHENHKYENCRFVHMNEKISENMYTSIIKNNGLDILCVAAHYSKRFQNSEQFIENKTTEDIKRYVFYLKNNTSTQIMNEFCDMYIIENKSKNTSINSKMEWKELHFLWKQFLSNNHYQNMIYSHALKSLFQEKYKYDGDLFYNISSKYLPIQSDFLKFWNSTIHVLDINNTNSFVNDIEIDEICALFKLWSKTSNVQQKTQVIQDDDVLSIISHFCSDVEISEDKYLLNITSLQWDKINDIKEAINNMKDKFIETKETNILSIDELYNHYYNYCYKISDNKLVVSKRFLEKYIYYHYNNIIVFDKFIDIHELLKII